MLDRLNPRLMTYLLSWMHSVPNYIYTKPPIYNMSPIINIPRNKPVNQVISGDFINFKLKNLTLSTFLVHCKRAISRTQFKLKSV